MCGAPERYFTLAYSSHAYKTLDQAGKGCQVQTLNVITNFVNYISKKDL